MGVGIMEAGIFMIIILIIAAIIYIAITTSFRKENNNRQRINISARKEFVNNNLNVDRIIVLEDKITTRTKKINLYGKLIFVDENKEKIGLIDYEKSKLFIMDYSEILSYKIYENEDMSSSGYTSKNGFFAGSTEKVSSNLVLLINTNIKSIPQLKYVIIDSSKIRLFRVKKNSKEYKSYHEAMENACAYLDIILNDKKQAEKIIFCTYCGAKNNASNERCISCGSAFKK